MQSKRSGVWKLEGCLKVGDGGTGLLGASALRFILVWLLLNDNNAP